MQERQG